jgi:hypothetical protein
MKNKNLTSAHNKSENEYSSTINSAVEDIFTFRKHSMDYFTVDGGLSIQDVSTKVEVVIIIDEDRSFILIYIIDYNLHILIFSCRRSLLFLKFPSELARMDRSIIEHIPSLQHLAAVQTMYM